MSTTTHDPTTAALVELEEAMTEAWRQYDPFEPVGYDIEGDLIYPDVDERPLPDDWRNFDAPEPWRTVSEFLRRKGVTR